MRKAFTSAVPRIRNRPKNHFLYLNGVSEINYLMDENKKMNEINRRRHGLEIFDSEPGRAWKIWARLQDQEDIRSYFITFLKKIICIFYDFSNKRTNAKFLKIYRMVYFTII